jgi:hypothetical protein
MSGCGRNVKWIRKILKEAHITCVDQEPKMTAAVEALEDPEVATVTSDIRELDWKAPSMRSYKLTVGWWCLCYLHKSARLILLYGLKAIGSVVILQEPILAKREKSERLNTHGDHDMVVRDLKFYHKLFRSTGLKIYFEKIFRGTEAWETEAAWVLH